MKAGISDNSVSKRAKSVSVSFKTPTRGEIAHLVIDSTGLKVFGEGEWKVNSESPFPGTLHGWLCGPVAE